jgi:transcriptional regulator with XRE-family HTH domain
VDIKGAVGRNIRLVRKAQGLSQLVLAERSELSADFIGKVERGTTSPSIEDQDMRHGRQSSSKTFNGF